MNVSLLHIGLPKTATTSLQNVWRKHPEVNLTYHGLIPLIEAARCLGKGELVQGNVQFNYDVEPQPGQKIILSHESLSTAYVNERATVERIRKYQAIAVQLMQQIDPQTRILLVVREPKRWIRSMYNQCVKQGGIDTFPLFLQREKSFILETLNIQSLFSLWSATFGIENIRVLPMELFRDDENLFHQILHNFCGTPTPSTLMNDLPKDNRLRNTGFTSKSLNVMRMFNVWVEAFLRSGGQEEKQTISPQLQQSLNVVRFAVRHKLEQPSPLLARLTDTMQNQVTDCQVGDEFIDDNFIQVITKRFADFLKGDEFYGYRTLYTAE